MATSPASLRGLALLVALVAPLGAPAQEGAATALTPRLEAVYASTLTRPRDLDALYDAARTIEEAAAARSDPVPLLRLAIRLYERMLFVDGP